MKAKKKAKINWKKIKDYKRFGIFTAIGKKILPVCILCEGSYNIGATAFWVDDERKRVIMYFLCNDCADEFFNLSGDERDSIVAKVIERKIDALMLLPHPKSSQLLERGFEFVF